MARFGDPKTENQVKTAKRVNYLALLFLVSMLATSFYFFIQLQNKQAELEEKTRMLADSTDNLRRIRTELEAAQRELTAREEKTLTMLESVSELVLASDYDEAKEVARSFDVRKNRSLINANLYAFGVTPAEKKAVEDYLRGSHIHLNVDTNMTQAPAWLLSTSTVLFYDSKAETTARRIAEGLTASTGKAFVTALGPATDIPKFGRGEYFNIHYVNPDKVVKQKAFQKEQFQQQILQKSN